MRVPTHRAALFLRMVEVLEKIALIGIASVRVEVERDWREIAPDVRSEVKAMREELHATEGPTV